MPDERGVWELRLGIYATERQAEEIRESISRLLCPDPDHAPPCPVPWSLSLLGDADLANAYPELLDQARIEAPGEE